MLVVVNEPLHEVTPRIQEAPRKRVVEKRLMEVLHFTVVDPDHGRRRHDLDGVQLGAHCIRGHEQRLACAQCITERRVCPIPSRRRHRRCLIHLSCLEFPEPVEEVASRSEIDQSAGRCIEEERQVKRPCENTQLGAAERRRLYSRGRDRLGDLLFGQVLDRDPCWRVQFVSECFEVAVLLEVERSASEQHSHFRIILRLHQKLIDDIPAQSPATGCLAQRIELIQHEH